MKMLAIIFVFTVSTLVQAETSQRYGGLSQPEFEKRRAELELVFGHRLLESADKSLDCINSQQEKVATLKVGDLLERAVKERSLRERLFYTSEDVLKKRIHDYNESWSRRFAEEVVMGGFNIKAIVVELPATESIYLQGHVDEISSNEMNLRCVVRAEAKSNAEVN